MVKRFSIAGMVILVVALVAYRSYTHISHGNSAKNHVAYEHNGWLYYLKESDGNRIYRMRPDGSQDSIFHYENINGFIIQDSWIYFSNYNDGGKLYRMKPDRSEETRISKERALDFTVCEDWIFYSAGEAGELMRMKTDGRGKKTLGITDVYEFSVEDNWIYYTKETRDESREGIRCIYRVEMDGSGKTLLCRDKFSSVSVSGGWIYYLKRYQTSAKPKEMRTKWRLIRMKTSGSGKELVLEDNVYSMDIAGEWIYYVGDRGLFRVNEREPKMVRPFEYNQWHPLSVYCVAEDWVILRSRFYYLKIRKDGSGSSGL